MIQISNNISANKVPVFQHINHVEKCVQWHTVVVFFSASQLPFTSSINTLAVSVNMMCSGGQVTYLPLVHVAAKESKFLDSKEGKKAITQQLLFHMCNGSPPGKVATYMSIKTKRKRSQSRTFTVLQFLSLITLTSLNHLVIIKQQHLKGRTWEKLHVQLQLIDIIIINITLLQHNGSQRSVSPTMTS